MDFATSIIIGAELRHIAKHLARKRTPISARHARKLARIAAFIQWQGCQPQPRRRR